MSFVNATLVLSIGETVEEVTDSGFLGTTPTLSCSLLGEDALVQVGAMSLLISLFIPVKRYWPHSSSLESLRDRKYVQVCFKSRICLDLSFTRQHYKNGLCTIYTKTYLNFMQSVKDCLTDDKIKCILIPFKDAYLAVS